MKLGNFRRTRKRTGQRGYILLTLVLFCVLMLIALTAEAPSMAGQARHDREDELIHRGVQYARAIKRYYKKFGSYPATMEQLEETNKMRFLRQRYKDPMTDKGFRPVRYGDPDLPATLMGSGGTTIAGATSVANLAAGSANTQPGWASGSPAGQAATSDQGTSGTTSNMTGSASGQAPGPTSPTSPFQPLAGSQIGGGAIIGVASTSTKEGFHEFNKKRQYKQWLFIYDPTTNDRTIISGPYNGPPNFTPVNNPITIFMPGGGLGPGGSGRGGGQGPGNPAASAGGHNR